MYAQRGLSLLFSFPFTLDEEGVPVRHKLRSYCSIAGALFLLGPVKCANESTADLFRSTGDVRACHVCRPSSVGVVSGQRLTSPSHGHVQWWQCDSCELARNSVHLSCDASKSITLFWLFEEGSGITQASAGEWNAFLLLFQACRHFSRGPMLLCGLIFLVSTFRLVFFPQLLEPTEFATEVTFLHNS